MRCSQKIMAGVTIEELSDELSSEMKGYCQGILPTAEVKISPPGTLLPGNFPEYMKKIRDLEVREDDVWVISFPKCGE